MSDLSKPPIGQLRRDIINLFVAQPMPDYRHDQGELLNSIRQKTNDLRAAWRNETRRALGLETDGNEPTLPADIR